MIKATSFEKYAAIDGKSRLLGATCMTCHGENCGCSAGGGGASADHGFPTLPPSGGTFRTHDDCRVCGGSKTVTQRNDHAACNGDGCSECGGKGYFEVEVDCSHCGGSGVEPDDGAESIVNSCT